MLRIYPLESLQALDNLQGLRGTVGGPLPSKPPAFAASFVKVFKSCTLQSIGRTNTNETVSMAFFLIYSEDLAMTTQSVTVITTNLSLCQVALCTQCDHMYDGKIHEPELLIYSEPFFCSLVFCSKLLKFITV
jgi:hypothetical protein